MKSAYSMAIQDLKEIREKNRAIKETRLDEVRLRAPLFNEIEQGLAKGGTALARCVLSGSENFEEIKKSMQKLRKQKEDILTSLKLPVDYLDDIYSCENCHDTGFDENGLRCGCLERLITSHASEGSNLTDFMKEQTFENFDFSLFANQPNENGRQPLSYIKSAVEKAKVFAETFDTTHQNLLFIGNAGTGKTYLTSCIANYALGREKSVLYQTSFQMFDMLENLKFGKLDGNEAESAEYIKKRIYDTDLLIIDDLGTEFVTVYSTSTLFDIINTRQLKNLSTVISTNLNADGLEKMYSRRLFSRLLGNYKVISFIGKDLRMTKLQKN